MQGKLTTENVLRILAQAGIDISRAQRDLAANQNEIDAILARHQEQATALGYEGTPAFVIGDIRAQQCLILRTLRNLSLMHAWRQSVN